MNLALRIYIAGVVITALLLWSAIHSADGKINDSEGLGYFIGICLLWPLAWAAVIILTLVVTIVHVGSGGTIEEVFTKPWWNG